MYSINDDNAWNDTALGCFAYQMKVSEEKYIYNIIYTYNLYVYMVKFHVLVIYFKRILYVKFLLN